MLAVAECEWLLCCAAHDDQLSVAACSAHDTAKVRFDESEHKSFVVVMPETPKWQHLPHLTPFLFSRRIQVELFTQQICTLFQTKLNSNWTISPLINRSRSIEDKCHHCSCFNSENGQCEDFLNRKSNGDVTWKFTVSSSFSLYHTHTLIHTHAIYIIARMAKLLVKCSLPSVTWSGAVY